MFDYTLRPISKNKYEVERSHRPSKNLFTLIDVPVDLPDYLAVVEDDYTQTNGRFLKSVVMVKVVDEKGQRFFSNQLPYKLESFDRSGRMEKIIEPIVLSHFLSEVFQIPEVGISAALSMVEQQPIELYDRALTHSAVSEGNAP